MTFALLVRSVVTDIITAEEQPPQPDQGWWRRIDDANPRPEIGWWFDSIAMFFPPPPPEQPMTVEDVMDAVEANAERISELDDRVTQVEEEVGGRR